MKLGKSLPNPQYIAYELKDSKGKKITHKGEQIYVALQDQITVEPTVAFYTQYEIVLEVPANNETDLEKFVSNMDNLF